MSDIALIGMGCMFPDAADPDEFWRNIVSGKDSIRDVPLSHWRPEDYFDQDPKTPDKTYAHKGGFLKPYAFDPLAFGIAPHAIEATDTSQLLGMVVAHEALKDAGYGPDRHFDRNRVSCIMGVTGTLELVIPLGARLGHPIWRQALKDAGVEPHTAQDVMKRIAASYVGWQENSFPGLLGNVVAGRIASRLDLGGTNCVVDAACASSLAAVHTAMLELRAGRCDMVVTGGVDTFNDIFMYMCFSKTPALSPSGQSRPFDHQGNGTTLGEGLGAVILRRREDAERDGDRIYALIKGMGTSSDGRGQAIYAPAAKGQVKALRRAYAEAGTTPGSIGLIEAHGTGTKIGDATEIKALTMVWEHGLEEEGADAAAAPLAHAPLADSQAYPSIVGSIKSQIGHTKAAAGVAGLIKATLALYHKILPPSIKVQEPLLELRQSPFAVLDQARPWLTRRGLPRRAGVSAFGFGGSNFHCVLEEYGRTKRPCPRSRPFEIFCLSAASPTALVKQVEDTEAALRREESLAVLAYESRQSFKREQPERLIIVLDLKQDDPLPLFSELAEILKKPLRTPLPPGCFHGHGATPQGIALAFPDASANYPNMGAGLAVHWPEFFRILERAEDLVMANMGESLAAQLYPPTRYDAAADHNDRLRLATGPLSHPAFAAVSAGLIALLRHFGLPLSGAWGLGQGHRAALHAGGNLDLDAFLSGQEIASNSGTALCPVWTAPNASEAAAAGPPPAGLDVGDLTAGAAWMRRQGITTVLAMGPGSELRAKLESLNDSDLTVLCVDPESNLLSGFVNTLACLSACGQPVAWDAWDCGHRPKAEHSSPGRLTVKLSGANHFIPKHLPPTPRPVLARDTLKNLGDNTAKSGLDTEDTNHSPPPHGVVPSQLAAKDALMNKLNDPSDSSLATTHESLLRLIQLQEQTAALHKTFLDNQRHSQELFARLISRETGSTPAQDLIAPVTQNLGRPEAQGTAWNMQPSAPSLAPSLEWVPGGSNASPTLPHPVSPSPKFRPSPTLDRDTVPAAFAVTKHRGVETIPPATSSVPTPVASEPPPLTGVASVATESKVFAALRAVIAEKTGYPLEMLEADHDLENDLGIDSIKRVEIFADLAAIIPAAKDLGPEQSAALRTIAAIAAALEQPSAATEEADAVREHQDQRELPSNSLTAAKAQSSLLSIVTQVVADKTGYPVEMLQQDLELEGDLGIDSIKRVEIFSGISEIRPDLRAPEAEALTRVRTIADVAAAFSSEAPQAPADPASTDAIFAAKPGAHEPTAKEPLQSPAKEPFLLSRIAVGTASWPLAWERPSIDLGPQPKVALMGQGPRIEALTNMLQDLGIHVLPIHADALEPLPLTLDGLIIAAPEQPLGAAATEAWLLRALQVMRLARPALRAAAASGNAICITITWNNGAFGLKGLGETANPYAAGLHGMLKTAAQEWTEVLAKAIDVTLDLDPATAAARLAHECLTQGPLEIGLAKDHLITPQLTHAPLGEAGAFPLTAEDRILITGGARGITGGIARALARQTKAHFILLGTTALNPEEDFTRDLHDGPTIKRVLREHRPTDRPSQLDAAACRILAAREVQATLAAMSAAGATAEYHSCDLRDATAVGTVMSQVLEGGPVTALIHGAGVLQDRLIEDKTDEQFLSVYGTKVRGLDHLLTNLDKEGLKLLALFSSSSGRYGRKGQVDYAAANEVLNKLAQAHASQWPTTRVLALNWGPWNGGMVSPGLARLFTEEGVGLIPLEDGAQYFLQELAAPQGPIELVVLAGASQEFTKPASAAAASSRAPRDESSVPEAEPTLSDLTQTPAVVGEEAAVAALPQAEKLAQADSPALDAAVFDSHVTLASYAVLSSHVIDGNPVVPAALVMEWLAHGALKANPGLAFHGLSDFRVLKGIVLDSAAGVGISVTANKAIQEGSFLTCDVLLYATFADGRTYRCAGARAFLCDLLPRDPSPTLTLNLNPHGRSSREIYELLFHGHHLQGLVTASRPSELGFEAVVKSGHSPRRWLKAPYRGHWLLDPMVIDGAFQLLTLWSYEALGSYSLPCGFGSYVQYRSSFPKEELVIRASITQVGGPRVTATVEFIDCHERLIARIDGYECIMEERLSEAFKRRTILDGLDLRRGAQDFSSSIES